MQPARTTRAPGSFSPLTTTNTGSGPPRPPPRRVESSGSEDNISLSFTKPRGHASSNASGTPIYAQFTAHQNTSSSSLQNFSRPSLNTGRSNPNPGGGDVPTPTTGRSASGLTATGGGSGGERGGKGHRRNHSQTQGLFEPTLPSTSTSNLSQVGMAAPSSTTSSTNSPAMSASQIAAQAAVLSHQQQQGNAHARQRSQTVPTPGLSELDTTRRGSSSKGPLSPPMVSLTEASGPREGGFSSQGYRNGLLGNHTAAATTAANVVFPRSGQTSPLQPSHPHSHSFSHSPSPQPLPPAEKPAKGEKLKGKLFSRPRKIVTKGETDEKPLPSPGKIGTALSALQRGNFSTTSLVDSPVGSLYSLANSSSATIRPVDAPEKEGKEKEKRHHFLSRQKHKLKEEYHLSSASSNSKPSDPYAPSSLYNFNLPPSPAPTTTSFPKGISDLRHGGRRDKKKEERSESRLDTESIFNFPAEWGGPSSYTSLSNASTALLEPIDPSKYGLTNMSYDDAWPFLKAKLFVIFEGEDLRLPVEDLNRAVLMHIQYCIQRRSPNIIVEDIRDLLATGFSSLDHALRKTPEDRVIPALVELWLFTFTSILPYMQAVFLPLDLEFAGCGTLLSAEQARDFWGGVIETSPGQGPHLAPASSVIDVRRLVLTAYRDIVILPRYDTLKTIFSRLSLEFLPSSLASMALASPLPDHPNLSMLSTSPSESFASVPRPGTAMSLDPSVASYNSSSTTLLGDSTGSRSRAISNVSFGSATASDGGLRPFTPSSLHLLGSSLSASTGNAPTLVQSHSGTGSLREQNVEDSKQVTELVGRMLQCMSVLASVGADLGGEGNEKMEELCRLLKLNWLGRGRTGRNRRGIVGGRVRRERPGGGEEVRVA